MQTPNTLNITVGTDVILHVTLTHDGETINPELIEDLSVALVSGLAKKTTLEATIESDHIVVQIPWVDGRLPGCYSLELKGTINDLAWSSVGRSIIRYTSATEIGASTVSVGGDRYDVTMVLGYFFTDSPIEQLEVTTDGNVGTPSVDYSYIRRKMQLDFHNLKGDTGDRGNGITSINQSVISDQDGEVNVVNIKTTDDQIGTNVFIRNGRQGPKGDSLQPIGDVSGLVLAHTTGQDDTKAMSQMGVTDAIGTAMEKMGEYVTIEQFIVSKMAFVDGNVITSVARESKQTCWYTEIKAGDRVKITATNSSSAGFRVAFAEELPAVGVTVQGKTALSGTSVNTIVVSPVDGYVVINHNSDAFADRVVKVLRRGEYSEMKEKAPLKTLMDVIGMLDYGLSNIETEVQPYENSLNKNGSLVTQASGSFRTYEFTVQSEKLYQIHGRLYQSGGYVGYVFYNSQWTPLAWGEETNGTTRTFDTIVMSPKGAAYLRVSGNTNTPGKLAELVSGGNDRQKVIYPKMSYEYLSNVSSTMGFFSISMAYNRAVSTIRFIKVNGGFSVFLPENRAMRVFEFDGDFQCLRYKDYAVTANVEQSINVGKDASYIKILLMKELASGSDDISIVRMRLKGSFPDNWDTFNISQFGCDLDDFTASRQLVIVRVHVTDPSCCDDDSNTLQDNGRYIYESGLIDSETVTWERYGQYLWDYGRMYLPATYDNLGEPTRLIIYCHGAAVNYNTGSASPEEIRDLDPTYWLAEGYAILDVEGNPFNNDDEHIHSPQALECYVAAYKWAIEHYNLKRDGVFLGGRSLGGGSTIMLLRKECPIPVIAACPNVPSLQTALTTTPQRKTFWAKCCGLEIPDGFTFSDGRSANDRQVYMDNWDRWIKYVPILTMITDLPITAEDKEDFADHIWGTTDEVYVAYLKTKRAYAKCPIKIFACYEDGKINYKILEALYRMLINNGQIAELRYFHDSRYTPYSKDDDAHHYDTLDPAQRVNGVATRYGTTVDDVPIIYIEMLKFWRRYEQE